ncbi:MAG TPA: DUF2177 family protein [Hyphomicrobiaceae bacterium]|nr:DUF2177 family protein [Hyphomicrobiaceae bacterium]
MRVRSAITWMIIAIVVAVAFLALDLVWITLVAGPAFMAAFGDTMLESPRAGAALAFYGLYVFGLCFFAVAPALRTGRVAMAAGYGALLGLVAYGTFDLTVLAILKPATTQLAVMDMAWGSFVSAASASAGAWVGTRRLVVS